MRRRERPRAAEAMLCAVTKRSRRLWVALVALGTTAVAACAAAQVAGAGALPADGRIDRLVVDKSDHRMDAFSGERLVRTYRVAIGAGGLGPKRFEGDGHTPEGAYRIDRRHESRRFHRFLHVSYPNDEDRRRHRALLERGEIPEGTGIGGDIGVHGESDVAAVRALGRSIDWTAGCISVSDPEIEELYRAVVPNAVIEIRP